MGKYSLYQDFHSTQVPYYISLSLVYKLLSKGPSSIHFYKFSLLRSRIPSDFYASFMIG